MAKLIWGEITKRIFESGVDRGVLYTSEGGGIAWTGLTAVKEAPSGGSPTPYYQDGVKYLNVSDLEEFMGTIEAYTYPPEFEEYDGTMFLDGGLALHQQPRRPFGLSYRTAIGSSATDDLGYKLHIVYNILASPSERAYTSKNASIAPLVFSWGFTTTPIRVDSEIHTIPLAHVSIDSTKISTTLLQFIEDQLYGSTRYSPQLIELQTLIDFFDNPLFTFTIQAESRTGLSPLLLGQNRGDLIGSVYEGLYSAPSESRLTATAISGLYTLEN